MTGPDEHAAQDAELPDRESGRPEDSEADNQDAHKRPASFWTKCGAAVIRTAKVLAPLVSLAASTYTLWHLLCVS